MPLTLSSFHHGYYRKDEYDAIRFDINW